MAKVNSLLSERLKVPLEKLSKMTNLAELSSSGHLSSFSGVFKVSELSDKEQEELKFLLEEYREEGQDIGQDFTSLSAITSEVKAINNQAVLNGRTYSSFSNTPQVNPSFTLPPLESIKSNVDGGVVLKKYQDLIKHLPLTSYF